MHSCVLIIGDNPEEQLKPFDEERRTKFNDLTADYKKEYEGKDSNGKPFREIYKSFGEFAMDWHGAERNAAGRYGFWHNPNAQWDWYALGGRWKDFLPLRDGGAADTAIWRDVDSTKLEPTAAVLFDGRWYDFDDGFWHSTDEAKQDKEWLRRFKNIIKRIAMDAPVAIYDLHI